MCPHAGVTSIGLEWIWDGARQQPRNRRDGPIRPTAQLALQSESHHCL